MTESPLELLLLREIGETVRAIRRLEKERDRIYRRLERVRAGPKNKKRPRKGLDAAKLMV